MSKLSKFLYFLAVVSLGALFITFVILKVWVPFMWIPIGLTLGSIAAALWTDRGLLIEFFTVKTTKSGLSMGAMILLALGLLIGVNFIGAKKTKSFDFSQAQINSLSEQSVKVVKDLKDELKVLYFYKKGSECVEERKRAFQDLAQKYQDQNGKVNVEMVDMNSRPDLTQQYSVLSGVETAFIEYQGRKNKLEKLDEQEFTSAIIKASREKEKVVYFTSGHGELPFENSKDGQSMTALKELLEGNRYSVRSLNFSTAAVIPEDADVVFVLGPTQSFLDFEVKALRDYLMKGGQMVVALDPQKTHKLESLLKEVGVSLGGNFIATAVDSPMGTMIEPRVVQGLNFGTHAITKPFGRDQFTVFSLPQTLQFSPVEGIKSEDLVRTNSRSMAFNDTKFDKNGSRGPFSLGILVQGKFPGAKEAKEFSLVVFGGVAQLSDQLLYQNLNRDLALNSVSFLAKEENLISITPKDVTKTEIKLSREQFLIFLFGFIIPFPILLFGLSGFFWWRRRNA